MAKSSKTTGKSTTAASKTSKTPGKATKAAKTGIDARKATAGMTVEERRKALLAAMRSLKATSATSARTIAEIAEVAKVTKLDAYTHIKDAYKLKDKTFVNMGLAAVAEVVSAVFFHFLPEYSAHRKAFSAAVLVGTGVIVLALAAGTRVREAQPRANRTRSQVPVHAERSTRIAIEIAISDDVVVSAAELSECFAMLTATALKFGSNLSRAALLYPWSAASAALLPIAISALTR